MPEVQDRHDNRDQTEKRRGGQSRENETCQGSCKATGGSTEERFEVDELKCRNRSLCTQTCAILPRSFNLR